MSVSGDDSGNALHAPAALEEPHQGDGVPDDWQRLSPLAVLFFFGRMAKGVVGNLPTTLGTLAVLVAFARESIWNAIFFGIAVMVVLAWIAIVRYGAFRYRIDAQGVRIRQGVLERNELDLQFHRIQSVNIEQSLAYRWFGLVTVSFDTAGSTQQEGHLPAVTRQFADTLRRHVDARRSSRSLADEDAPARRNAALLQLNNADMLRIGLTDPTVLIVLAALPGLAQYSDSAAMERAQRMVDQATSELAASEPLLIAAFAGGALLVVLALILAVTTSSAFLRFHGYQLRLEGGAFRSRAGLLTRKEMVMDTRKIQQLRLTQSWALRCFGRYRLRALSATSGQGNNDQNNQSAAGQVLHVPILAPRAALDLRDRMLHGEGTELSLLPRSERFVGISARYIRARVVAIGLLPALIVSAAATPLFGAAALLGLAWLALVAICAWQSWRRRAYMHDDHGLAYRSGLIGFKVELFLFRKVQGATTSQSPLQRRHGLATLHVHLASGTVSIPFIDQDAAFQLRDYMLYKAESSRLAWH